MSESDIQLGPYIRTILIPLGGFSAFDSDGGPLPDPEARQCFADTLQNRLYEKSRLQILPYHINDPEFSQAVIRALAKIIRNPGSEDKVFKVE